MKPLSLLLVCTFLFLFSNSHAQQAEKFDAAADHKEIRGSVIRLMPSPNGGFGFSVMKDKIMLWSQLNNPFMPGKQTGFTHKADAYKLAEWVVSEKEKNSLALLVMPKELAKQLNITERLPQ